MITIAHFYYNFDDLFDDVAIGRALKDNQKNNYGPTKTSASSQNRSQISTSTYGLSQILQGEALFYPTGYIYDNFNQTLSSDLGGFLRMEADDELLGGRKALIGKDIQDLPGYGDAVFSGTLGGIAGAAGGVSGGTGGVPASTLQEAIPLLKNNVNILWSNSCFDRVESGEVDASILNCIWFISQHMWVEVWNMKRDYNSVSNGVSQHFVGPGEKGRAADLGAFGPDRRNGGSQVAEAVINHGQYTEQAFRVLDSLPQPMWPSEIVLGPYDYTPQAHSGINFDTNSDHNDHIHVGYREYHDWMGPNQAPLPGTPQGPGSAGTQGPGTAPSTGPPPRPTTEERKYRQFLRHVTALDNGFNGSCPLSESRHESYMFELKLLFSRFDIDWNFAASSGNSWGYRWTPGRMINGRRARPQTPCEK